MRIKAVALLAASLTLIACTPNPGPTPLGSPSPILYLTGVEAYSTGGKDWMRHNYDVLNKDLYDPALFAAAPTLPPCGLNNNAARTWVDFYDAQGNRLYGFCALGSPADLGRIWFATEEGTVPPSWVYIQMHDRQTNTIYKSNLAETVP